MMIRLIVILFGVMSYANPGVLETVAHNRAAGITDHQLRQNWYDYDILLATESCGYVNRTGTLYLEDGRRLSALVVDCQDPADIAEASLTSLGLLADGNMWSAVHQKAILVLRIGEHKLHPIQLERIRD